MKLNFYGILAVMAVFMTLTTSCKNNAKQSNTTEETTKVQVMDVDSLLSIAPEMVNKEVTFDGICTHACKHGATKIFLMGSDDTKTIRAEAGELGSFDTKCINNVVRITGIVKEQRIDEAYLSEWEARLKAEKGDRHGEQSSGGCQSEKNARGEVANTPEERIANFRKQIAEREAKEGKPYLSFYYIDTKNYEVE